MSNREGEDLGDSFGDLGDFSWSRNGISALFYYQLWVSSMLWGFDPLANHNFIFMTKLITYSALHSFCQASWYFTGSSCRVTGSKSAESIYLGGLTDTKQNRMLENWLYTAVWLDLHIKVAVSTDHNRLYFNSVSPVQTTLTYFNL